MNKTYGPIEVLHKPSFGRDLFEPLSEGAKTFCKLLGQTTLTAEQLRLLKELGCKVEIKQREVVL